MGKNKQYIVDKSILACVLSGKGEDDTNTSTPAERPTDAVINAALYIYYNSKKVRPVYYHSTKNVYCGALPYHYYPWRGFIKLEPHYIHEERSYSMLAEFISVIAHNTNFSFVFRFVSANHRIIRRVDPNTCVFPNVAQYLDGNPYFCALYIEGSSQYKTAFVDKNAKLRLLYEPLKRRSIPTSILPKYFDKVRYGRGWLQYDVQVCRSSYSKKLGRKKHGWYINNSIYAFAPSYSSPYIVRIRYKTCGKKSEWVYYVKKTNQKKYRRISP